MATYFVFNVSRPIPHSAEYPGTRVDADNEIAALNAYARKPEYGAQPGDVLRWVLNGPNYLNFATVAAGPQTANPSAAPAMPPVGG